MRTLELKTGHPELDEVLDLASSENVILTTPDGRRFVLAEIDDFEAEIRLVREHAELMKLLDARSDAGRTFTLDEVKKELGIEG
jgi:hypothetical protein